MNADTMTLEQCWEWLAERLPELREECPCVKGEGRGFPNLCDGINHWFDFGGCKRCYNAGHHLPDCFTCRGTDWITIEPHLETLSEALGDRDIALVSYYRRGDGCWGCRMSGRGTDYREVEAEGHNLLLAASRAAVKCVQMIKEG